MAASSPGRSPCGFWPMPDDDLARHSLAWLAPAACAGVSLHGRACIDRTAARSMLADWVARGHPLIVTRQPDDAGNRVALGLALPPKQGKFRLGFLVDRSAITRIAPAPTLAEAGDCLPSAWAPKIAALLASSAIGAAQPRVYGSAAMQMHSGEACVAAGSDLDLSLAPATWPAVQAVLAALADIDSSLPGPRIDGEILAPDGGAVAWRELRGEPAKVLVKRRRGVDLEATANFRAAFSPAASHAA